MSELRVRSHLAPLLLLRASSGMSTRVGCHGDDDLCYNVQKHFTKAREVVNLNFVLSGALGKRTRFQQDDTAQLFLEVTSDPSCSIGRKFTTTIADLPKVKKW